MPILKKILHPRRRSQIFNSGEWTEEQISAAIASKSFSSDQTSQMYMMQQQQSTSAEIYASPVPYLGYSNEVLPTTDPPPQRFTNQRVTPRQTTEFFLGTSREDKTLVQEHQTEIQTNSPDIAKELDFIRQQLALFEVERADWKEKFKVYQAREDQMRKEIQDNQNQINQLRQQKFVQEEDPEVEQQHPSRHNSYQTVSTSSYTDENYFDTAEIADEEDNPQLNFQNYYSPYYLQQWRNYYHGYR